MLSVDGGTNRLAHPRCRSDQPLAMSDIKIAAGLELRAQPIQQPRSEEHTSELQSLMRISYAVFCLKKKKINSHDIKHQIIEIHKTNKTETNNMPHIP